MHSYSRNKVKKWSALIVSLIIFIFLLSKTLLGASSAVISPLASTEQKSSSILFSRKARDLSELISQIKELTASKSGSYTVYIYDLTKNIGAGINETTILTAASVNKIPILAVLYFEAQSGKIDLDQKITIQASDIQDYGTGIIRYQDPGGVYSLKSLAQLMMQKSDNTAAYILSGVVGEAKTQELINNWGLTQTDIVNNKTSVKDMGLLLIKMYKGQIANQALTSEMLGSMGDSDFEDRLPGKLPKEIKVYHKIGNEIGNVHDVGIVAIPKHPYYIGVMTNDIINEDETKETIADISKITFDFMQNQ